MAYTKPEQTKTVQIAFFLELVFIVMRFALQGHLFDILWIGIPIVLLGVIGCLICGLYSIRYVLYVLRKPSS